MFEQNIDLQTLISIKGYLKLEFLKKSGPS